MTDFCGSWLLSAISALAEYEGAIERLFSKTPDLFNKPTDGWNTYVITLYNLPTGMQVDVSVDETLCTQSDSLQLLGAEPSLCKSGHRLCRA